MTFQISVIPVWFDGFQIFISISRQVSSNSFGKAERLKTRKLIGELFSRGKTIKAFPVTLVWMLHSEPMSSPLLAGVSVSKKKFQKAIDRNRIKRLLREAYRKNKHELLAQVAEANVCCALMLIFSGNKIPSYLQVEEKVIATLSILSEKIKGVTN